MSHLPPIVWADPTREAAFSGWLVTTAAAHQLNPSSLRMASADASFRRYFRVDKIVAPTLPTACGSLPPEGAELAWGGPELRSASTVGSCIVMDAPPAVENSEPFVRIAKLMADAGLRVPEVLAWDQANGFLLLSDLGSQTLLDVIDAERPQANLSLYLDAADALVAWQAASKPGVLPPYDEALLRRELQLFPDWYIARHRGVVLDDNQLATLNQVFDRIVANNLSVPSVYVHRDFMPRNLMAGRPLGVLDFQDAVYGPITYDIASLMRDAFLSWDEDFVIDVTVRYWQKAVKAGLLGASSPSGWGADFGEFYSAVEWMGLQRHLKVAGIFARLTLRDGKPKYLADAPRFMAYIRATTSRYTELKPLLRLIDQVEGIETVAGFTLGRA